MQKTQETRVRSLSQDDPVEEEMATHSSILAWRIPWTEEPGGPQSISSHRFGQALATKHASMHMPINEQVAHALKPCTLWTGSAGIFKGQVRESGGRVHDQLMHGSHRLMVR